MTWGSDEGTRGCHSHHARPSAPTLIFEDALASTIGSDGRGMHVDSPGISGRGGASAIEIRRGGAEGAGNQQPGRRSPRFASPPASDGFLSPREMVNE